MTDTTADLPRPLAVVTGARRGIGAAIAIELASVGFDLALTDREAADAEVDSVMRQIMGHGARCYYFNSDLEKIDQHANLVARIVDRGGSITCLVNNAGVGAPSRGDLLDLTPEAFDQVLGINLRGNFFMTQAVARHMQGAQEKNDHAVRKTIVTISSVSAEMASIERGEYCISKSALAMMNKLFSVRLAPLGIGVFEVRPGVIRTPMTQSVANKYEQRFAEGLVPMNRWGYPEDVARAVRLLAQGDIVFATGSILNVDGGLSIARL